MAFIPEDFADSQSQSGECPQESGDEGLSTNMRHKISNTYEVMAEPALPVAETGFCVRPIPKVEQDIYEPSEEKMSETQSVFAGKVSFRPDGLAKAQENNPPPKPPLMPPVKKSKEEAAMPLSETAAITEADEEKAGRDHCIVDSKMESLKEPANAQGQRKRRKNYSYGAAAVCLGLLVATSLVDVSSASAVLPAGNCFTCSDKRCQNLIKIFSDDNLRYERGLKDSFEACSETHPPTKNCTVCLDQSNVEISCPDDISKIDAEDNTSKPLDLLKSKCRQISYPGNYGATTGGSLFLVMVVALLISILFLQQD
ncbi:uncharacterized protein PAE49_005308 [Odontesthes bonariensis]|uniref:uncharacterized protein LOC142380849 n=1 Tax=Odontesthes bonariensis TaxID=219752 RepID=UPI003F586943